MFKTVITAAAAVLSLAAAASAATVDFEYTTGRGDVLAGTADVTLTATSGVVEINSVTDVTIGGAPIFGLDNVGSLVVYKADRTFSGPATASLDGSAIDLLACDAVDCRGNYFYFVLNGTDDRFRANLNSQYYLDNPIGDDFTVDTSNLTSAPAPAPVPLPASGLLLLAGLGGVAALRRRAKA